MTVGGAADSVYWFGVLHSYEFGAAGYLCPAYTCSIGDIYAAGYGWLIAASYAGVAFFIVGLGLLALSLVVSRS